MQCDPAAELHPSMFTNPNVITLHTGQFGLNMVNELYPCSQATASPDYRPKPILCDLDSECINKI